MSENIIYVDREELDLKIDYGVGAISDISEALSEKYSIGDRDSLEEDDTKKQIIPYAVLANPNTEELFVTRRKKAQGESRLHDKLSIGLGGHLNPSDCGVGPDYILSGLLRELKEEANVVSLHSILRLGYINNDRNEVGRVHLGILYLIFCDHATIAETDKMSGEWCDPSDINRDALEEWSKIAIEFLSEAILS